MGQSARAPGAEGRKGRCMPECLLCGGNHPDALAAGQELCPALAEAEAGVASAEARIDALKPMELEMARERASVTLDLAMAAVAIAKDAAMENAILRNLVVSKVLEGTPVPKSQSRGRGEDPLGRQHRLSEHPVEADARKGDASLLHNKDCVTIQTAARYLGVTKRAVYYAARKGSLTVGGVSPNSRISTESLLRYLPPEQL